MRKLSRRKVYQLAQGHTTEKKVKARLKSSLFDAKSHGHHHAKAQPALEAGGAGLPWDVLD